MRFCVTGRSDLASRDMLSLPFEVQARATPALPPSRFRHPLCIDDPPRRAPPRTAPAPRGVVTRWMVWWNGLVAFGDEVFYYNEQTDETSWDRPAPPAARAPPRAPAALPLPAGWTKQKTDEGKVRDDALTAASRARARQQRPRTRALPPLPVPRSPPAALAGVPANWWCARVTSAPMLLAT